MVLEGLPHYDDVIKVDQAAGPLYSGQDHVHQALECGRVLRVLSRAVLVKFAGPSVAPSSEDEEETYSELEALINSGKYSVFLVFTVF